MLRAEITSHLGYGPGGRAAKAVTDGRSMSETGLIRRRWYARLVIPNRFFVELGGFEPPTFSLRTRRATNCAIAPSAQLV